MMEVLIKRPTTLARYLGAPLAEERDNFLKHCAQVGYSPSMLKKISWVIWAVAEYIGIDHGKVTMQDIRIAVDHRTRFKRQSTQTKESKSTRQMLIHFATEWARHMGCLGQAAKPQDSFAVQIGIFARHMREERGLSPVTIATRCERLGWFFAGLNPPRGTLDAITICDLDAFVELKGQQGWTRASLGSLASSLRSFFAFAEARGWCAKGLTATIESPRLYTREGIPEGPGWEDVQRLLVSTAGDHPVDIRDRAILMLLALYGLRRGEVAALQLEHLDWDGDKICVVRPKQRIAQRYPLLPSVGEAIVRYLRDVRPQCEHRALFLTIGAPMRPLSAESISHVARARLNQLGLTLSPRGAHCLRHACASHLLSSGFSLKQIGDHLGHRNANSALSYTKVDLTGLRQVAEFDLGGLL